MWYQEDKWSSNVSFDSICRLQVAHVGCILRFQFVSFQQDGNFIWGPNMNCLIRAPLNFAPLIFVHPLISHLPYFPAPLFYCKFTVFSFICGILSSPFNFGAFVLCELAPFNFQSRCAEIKGAQILMRIKYKFPNF